jgi:hypothetical protein
LEPNLPLGYRLQRDPDLLLLLRPDGSVASALSARGPTRRPWNWPRGRTEGEGTLRFSWDAAAAGARAIAVAVAEGLHRRAGPFK